MIEKYLDYLKNYSGKELTLMEICGSHTAAIKKSGIKSVISPKIKLVSGPGCPVCVCPSGYIDKLIQLAQNGNTIVSFGDLLRVPGSRCPLNEIKGGEADVRMVYSPFDIIDMALTEKEKNFVFAAVGFETTIPVYCLLLDELEEKGITNVRLLTSLKCMGPVIEYLCTQDNVIDGFLAPGHVSVVTGAGMFRKLSEKYNIPFAVTGFSGKELVTGVFGLVRLCERGEGITENFYGSVVSEEGNPEALKKMDHYFMHDEAYWRGIGMIPGSGLYLKQEFSKYDAGSRGNDEDIKINALCCCDKVLLGRMSPEKCPLFGKECTPLSPQGACMVSSEGSCSAAFLN